MDLLKSTYKSIKFSLNLKHLPVVFLYHQIGCMKGYSKIHDVSPKRFNEHLKVLHKKYRFIFIDEFIAHLQAGESLSGLAALTFDDGFRSVLDQATPLLEKYRIPATLFLNTSFIEGRSFWRDQVQYLIDHNLEEDFIRFAGKEGEKINAKNFRLDTKNPQIIDSRRISEMLVNFMETNNLPDLSLPFTSLNELLEKQSPFLMVGNHSAHHFILSNLTREEQKREIETVDEILFNHFPSEKISRIFSVPFGSYASFNEDTLAVLQELNFKGFVFSQPGDYLKKQKKLAFEHNGLWGYKRFLPKNYMTFYWV